MILKNSIWAMLIACTLFSCKKEITSTEAVTQQQTEDNVLSTYQEQKSIYATVDANIGGYLEALPVDYTTRVTKRYPLLITLHGQGELGNGTSDLYKVKVNAIPRLLEAHQFPTSFVKGKKTFSFIVISPQFRNWPSADNINDMINYAIKKYRVDTTRIYVNGLSMGGGALWDYLRVYGKRVAAATPICGASYANAIKAQPIANNDVPVWAFHNDYDPTVPSSYTKNYVAYINSFSPPVPAKMTIFPIAEHDAWTKATDPNYRENGKNMYEWMLTYRRKP